MFGCNKRQADEAQRWIAFNRHLPEVSAVSGPGVVHEYPDVPGFANEGVGDFPRGFRLLQIAGDYPDRDVEPAAEFLRLRLKLRFNARDQHKPVSVRGKSVRKVQPDPARGARDFL
jgi:hypothetical protein